MKESLCFLTISFGNVTNKHPSISLLFRTKALRRSTIFLLLKICEDYGALKTFRRFRHLRLQHLPRFGSLTPPAIFTIGIRPSPICIQVREWIVVWCEDDEVVGAQRKIEKSILATTSLRPPVVWLFTFLLNNGIALLFLHFHFGAEHY